MCERLAWSVAIACALLRGQQFEAASLKPSAPSARDVPSRRMAGGPGTSSPGRIEYHELSLKDLLFTAYRVQFYQLPTPSWMEGEYFDIVATVPAGATQDDVRRMLQNLLAERFRLKIHLESRELPGYALTVGRSGPKLKASPPLAAAPDGPPKFGLDKDGFLIAPPGRLNMLTMPPRNGVARLTASRAGMEVLCGYLSRQLQQPVVDETSLPGEYDFRLAFAPALPSPPEGDAPAAADPAPTLVKAVERQLGLRMEPKRLPVDMLVIDHVERKPVEN